MRKEYDFSSARKNPYAAQLKKQITIRLDEESITYFKAISEDVGIPYQSSSTCTCETAQLIANSISTGSRRFVIRMAIFALPPGFFAAQCVLR